jgi:hypothetical protein
MYECEHIMQIPRTISVICCDVGDFAYDLLACGLFDCTVHMNTHKKSRCKKWVSILLDKPKDSWWAHKYTCCIIYIKEFQTDNFNISA